MNIWNLSAFKIYISHVHMNPTLCI